MKETMEIRTEGSSDCDESEVSEYSLPLETVRESNWHSTSTTLVDSDWTQSGIATTPSSEKVNRCNEDAKSVGSEVGDNSTFESFLGKRSRSVSCAKLLVALLLVGITVGVATVVFQFASTEEYEAYEARVSTGSALVMFVNIFL